MAFFYLYYYPYCAIAAKAASAITVTTFTLVFFSQALALHYRCKGSNYKDFPHQAFCSHYYKCAPGKKYMCTCQVGQEFDYDKHICLPTEHATCIYARWGVLGIILMNEWMNFILITNNTMRRKVCHRRIVCKVQRLVSNTVPINL